MSTKKLSLNFGMDRFSGVYLWALFIIVFGIWTPSAFLSTSTLHAVAASNSLEGILAIAVLIPLACGQFDLSVGATANVAGIITVVVQTSWHWPAVPAVALGIGIGLAIGAVNGLVVVKLGVSSFIATLGMGSILAAVQSIVTNEQQPLPIVSSGWDKFTQYDIGGFQIVVLYMVVIGFVAWWALQMTPFGRHIYLTGGNPEAARLSGIKTDRVAWTSLIISGGLSSIAGILYVSLTGPSLTFGTDLLLPAFAAAYLGSTQIKPGRFNVWGTLLAIYVLATGVEGLELVSGYQWLNDMFNGVALIAAVALAVSRERGKGGLRRLLSRPRSANGPSPTPPTVEDETLTKVAGTEA